MRIVRIGYGVKGFGRLHDYAIRWSRMVTEKAKQKARILVFWKKHGLAATTDGFKVCRRTLYLWKVRQEKGNGKTEALNERSRRPKTVRTRVWPFEVRQEIKRLRSEHPNLGKEKVFVFLKPFCASNRLPCPSVSTVGNLIKDMGGLRVFPTKVRHNGHVAVRKPQRKQRKPKGFVALYPGHCGSFDTIEKFVHGSRRYIITFTDVYSRFSFAWATTSHASQAAKEFFNLVTYVFPFPLAYVLTDNGSEFMKHFDAEVRELHKIHWHTYPRCPKMNPHDERFNRSIQEEYIDFHEAELFDTVHFNQGLVRHLLWHNAERPHWGLNFLSPIQFIMLNFPKECKMYLTDTLG